MKKRGNSEGKGAKSAQNEKSNTTSEKEVLEAVEDSENQGFGQWLRSNDGVEMMRLFVIANSILVFVTMAWPNLREMFNAIREYFTDEEEY